MLPKIQRANTYRPRHTMRQIDTSRRQVASSALLLRQGFALFGRCDMSHARIHQFEFVRQIAATKFYRSDNYFHMSQGAICCSNVSRRRVAAICGIVCLGLIDRIYLIQIISVHRSHQSINNNHKNNNNSFIHPYLY